jgi:hypothetical protein
MSVCPPEDSSAPAVLHTRALADTRRVAPLERALVEAVPEAEPRPDRRLVGQRHALLDRWQLLGRRHVGHRRHLVGQLGAARIDAPHERFEDRSVALAQGHPRRRGEA